VLFKSFLGRVAGGHGMPTSKKNNKKGDKRQQPTQCRCLNVYFLAIHFTL